jgi:putative addiction module component (TIGR02574 family)
MSIYEIYQLNVKEKIILMNNIWESLEVENELIESPIWHREVLEERIAKIKNNEVKYISLEELKNR